VLAAVHAICPNDRAPQGQEILGVDRRRLAALGWCLGGQPLLELARMTIATDGSLEASTGCYVRSMASFHGVYHRDDMPSPPTQASPDASAQIPQPEVLICNGQADPFVSVDDLTATKMAMNAKGCNVTIVQYDGARHGFSNPAQAFNENDAFDFNENAAKDSWTLTVDLLNRNLMH
jgi:dienelactone hydrolase